VKRMESRRITATTASSSLHSSGISSLSGITLEPSEVLVFNGSNTTSSNRQVETSLKLINNSDNYAVFKIKTTRPKAYCVRPNSGCLSPHTSQEVKVVMQQMENLAEDGPKHKFQVQTMPVAGPVKTDQLPELMKRETNVTETKLRCVWENIRLTDGTIYSSPPGSMNSNNLNVNTASAVPSRLGRVEEDDQRPQITTSTPRPNIAASARRPDIPEPQTAVPPLTAAKPVGQIQNPAGVAAGEITTPVSALASKNEKFKNAQLAAATAGASDMALAKGSTISWLLVLVAFFLGIAFAVVVFK